MKSNRLTSHRLVSGSSAILSSLFQQLEENLFVFHHFLGDDKLFDPFGGRELIHNV